MSRHFSEVEIPQDENLAISSFRLFSFFNSRNDVQARKILNPEKVSLDFRPTLKSVMKLNLIFDLT